MPCNLLNTQSAYYFWVEYLNFKPVPIKTSWRLSVFSNGFLTSCLMVRGKVFSSLSSTQISVFECLKLAQHKVCFIQNKAARCFSVRSNSNSKYSLQPFSVWSVWRGEIFHKCFSNRDFSCAKMSKSCSSRLSESQSRKMQSKEVNF